MNRIKEVLKEKGIKDQKVLNAINSTPRHLLFDLVFRDNLTELEMKSFITSIPSHQRQIVNRYVYIMRNV